MTITNPPAGHFTLLYFASSTSYSRKEHDFFPAPLPIAKLFDMLDEQYPGIKSRVLDSSAVTVNLDYVDVEEETGKGDAGLIIKEGDEVAIIPPPTAVSGDHEGRTSVQVEHPGSEAGQIFEFKPSLAGYPAQYLMPYFTGSGCCL
ncbi:hypothetical protein TI39_contig5844g00005 [Zymoseptoria brevis]|uniref:Molybdopterin synthase sulfur carrier subunit n=1 Tax=Zymoseptoria brevis TaxID=1047168 RepID=A0A0F4G555_9PEZI|nr:hypothetical protein TI39_contig5844g00005 [Zymoseptoria brevis]